jgi:hypothetical protein
MTAIEKLRAAFATQITRNINPHEEFVLVGSNVNAGGDACGLVIPPERESWQDADDSDDEPEFLTLFDMICVLDEIKELMARPPLEREPEAPSTDPHQRYMQILAEWIDDKQKLAFYKEREKQNRLLLFAGTFPNPKEGTQKHKLPDGRTIKAQYRINRKIDEAALPATLAKMRELGVANADALVNFKPTLAKREWNTLSEDNKLQFSPAVIATPGTPTLDLEPAKGA